MMGTRGLEKATEQSILNANYIADKLKGDYKVLFTGKTGRYAVYMHVYY
jgi:glycine dehydrogenase